VSCKTGLGPKQTYGNFRINRQAGKLEVTSKARYPDVLPKPSTMSLVTNSKHKLLHHIHLPKLKN
jgi:hypothetical protein